MSNRSLTIGVIGNQGHTGSWWINYWLARGFVVCGSDIGTKFSNVDVVHAADVVFVCVPISCMKDVARQITPHLCRDQLVIITASVMTAATVAFQESSATVYGLHLLAAPPGVLSLSGLSAALIQPKRCTFNKWDGWIQTLLNEEGVSVVSMRNFGLHDRLATPWQVPFQASLLVAVGALLAMGVKVGAPNAMMTLFSKMAWTLTARLLRQGDVYAEIFAANHAAALFLRHLEGEARLLADLSEKKDLVGITNYIQELKKGVGKSAIDEGATFSMRVAQLYIGK